MAIPKSLTMMQSVELLYGTCRKVHMDAELHDLHKLAAETVAVGIQRLTATSHAEPDPKVKPKDPSKTPNHPSKKARRRRTK